MKVCQGKETWKFASVSKNESLPGKVKMKVCKGKEKWKCQGKEKWKYISERKNKSLPGKGKMKVCQGKEKWKSASVRKNESLPGELIIHNCNLSMSNTVLTLAGKLTFTLIQDWVLFN